MISKFWEIRAMDAPPGYYEARERRTGRDGYGVRVDAYTGTRMTGTLRSVHAELVRRHHAIVDARRFCNDPDVVELWW